MVTSVRPKIGLALSGAASKSIFYIGFLEAISESGVPVDFIAASSGATIPAASFACGTLPELKRTALEVLDRDFMFSLLDRSKLRGGFYTLDKVEEALGQFTKNYSFEQVRPLLGFVAVDLHKGEQVVLSMGDIAHAARVSCTVPGVFGPVQWGTSTLIDGGLLNIIPGDVAREAGMDIVVGVNLRGNYHIFEPSVMVAKKVFNQIRRILLLNHAAKIWHQFYRALEQTNFLGYYSDLGKYNETANQPGIFSVLGRSLDLAMEATKHDKHLEAQNYFCDILITPQLSDKGPADFSQKLFMYERGREAGIEAALKIASAIGAYQPVREKVAALA